MSRPFAERKGRDNARLLLSPEGDGTKPGLWTGLDWTGLDSKMDWKTDVISLHEWAWLVTEVLLLGLYSNTPSSRE